MYKVHVNGTLKCLEPAFLRPNFPHFAPYSQDVGMALPVETRNFAKVEKISSDMQVLEGRDKLK